MNLSAHLAIAALAAVLAPVALATPDARAQREIDGLLAFVETSGCRFVRGGVEHDGREARAHLERKLTVARPLIGSADDFVRHVASASSVTGEPYRVRCGATEKAARAWLADELARQRRATAERNP